MGRPAQHSHSRAGLCPGMGSVEAKGLGGGWGPKQPLCPAPALPRHRDLRLPPRTRALVRKHTAPHPMRCGGTPIPAHWGVPLPSPSHRHVRARWPHRGSGPCSVGVKALCATMCHSRCPAPSRPGAWCHPRHPAVPGSAAGGSDTRAGHAAPRGPAHPAEAEGVGLVPGHSIVADQRVREHQDLRLVGGVCERLGVPHHAGLEHCKGWGWG